MTSKLSKLQRQVLALAYANASQGYSTSLREVVGMILGVQEVPDPHVERVAHAFRKDLLGYRAAVASASRTVRRLEARGLAYRHGTVRGCAVFALTPEGAQVAEGLTVSEIATPAADGKAKKRRRKILTVARPGRLEPKRLTPAELESAKDAEWRPLP